MSKEEYAIEINQVSKSVIIADENNSGYVDTFKRLILNRGYRRLDILQNIHVQVPPLKTLGIIGRNGSGKSSLLKLIAGITQPTAGYIKSKGKIAAILDIGSGFHPELTGRENIFFYGKILGMSQKEIRSKTEEIIAFSELDDTFINMPVKHYSNGMYLRLAFSIAVHSDVDIILFDEVLTVGDTSFNIKCFQKINEIRRRANVVLVSHNMEDITRVCDICVWLEEGKIKAIGEPIQVVGDYIEHTVLKKNIEDPNRVHAFSPISQNQITVSKFSVMNSSRQVTSLIDYAEDFTFDFEVDISKDIPVDTIPTIQIIDQNNNNILFSASVYQGSPFIYFKGNGKYRVTCQFPKKFLNRGIYRVTLYIFDINQNVHVEAPNITSFRMKIGEESLLSYLKNTSFSVSAALAWSLEEIR